MSPTIKHSFFAVLFPIMLGIADKAAGAKIFDCTSGDGRRIYTSEPSARCTDASLPKISSHQGGEYRLKITKLSSGTDPEPNRLARKRTKQPKQASRTEKKSAKQAASRKKDSDQKTNTPAKAKSGKQTAD